MRACSGFVDNQDDICLPEKNWVGSVRYPERNLWRARPIMFGDQRVIKNGYLLKSEIPGIGITMNDKIEKDFSFDEKAVYSCVTVDRGQPNDAYWKE